MSVTFATMLSQIKTENAINSTDRDGLMLRFVNDTVQEIWDYGDWDHYADTARVWTLAKYSTGTVSVANGSTTVSSSGAVFTSSMIGGFITFTGDSRYYVIANVTATGSPLAYTITLDEAYQDTSKTDSTYYIEQARLPIPSDFARVIRLFSPLNYLVPCEVIAYSDWLYATTKSVCVGGNPTSYCAANFNGTTYIHVYPTPVTKDCFSLIYKRKITECAGTGSPDLVDVPVELEKAVRQGVRAKIALWERDNGTFNAEYQRFMQILDKVWKTHQKNRELPKRLAMDAGAGYGIGFVGYPQQSWFS